MYFLPSRHHKQITLKLKSVNSLIAHPTPSYAYNQKSLSFAYIDLECTDPDPRRCPSPAKSDEVFAANVAGKQRGADLE